MNNTASPPSTGDPDHKLHRVHAPSGRRLRYADVGPDPRVANGDRPRNGHRVVRRIRGGYQLRPERIPGNVFDAG